MNDGAASADDYLLIVRLHEGVYGAIQYLDATTISCRRIFPASS